jgi:hypothetical protein
MTTSPYSRIGSQASYILDVDQPPAWLVAVTPGGPEAYAEWQAANARGADASAALRVASREFVEFRNSQPLDADLDVAKRALADKQAAVDAAGLRALSALRRFDDLLTKSSASFTEADRQALAAAYALEQQKVAEEALATLTAALAARDSANEVAGSPGKSWRDNGPALFSNPSDGARALTIVAGMIGRFDSGAVAAVAEGADPADLRPLTEVDRFERRGNKVAV